MRRSTPPLARRFHRRPGSKLAKWETAIWLALHTKQPERRLMANVLADGMYLIYRSRCEETVREELDWLDSEDRGHAGAFLVLAENFDLEPETVRRDVRAALAAGTTALRL